MTLVKWNPRRSLLNYNDDLFGEFLRPNWLSSRNRGDLYPAVDIEENEDGYKIVADLPGLNKDDVKISYRDEVVVLSGEKKAENESDNKNYHCYERSFGKFERAFRFHSDIIVDKIDANFKDGVLTVSLPKSEIAKPKEIEIKVK